MQKMTPGYSLLQFSLRLSPVLDCNAERTAVSVTAMGKCVQAVMTAAERYSMHRRAGHVQFMSAR